MKLWVWLTLIDNPRTSVQTCADVPTIQATEATALVKIMSVSA